MNEYTIPPSGYTLVDYIQSSGTQYIDTGFKPNQNTRMTAKVYINGLVSTYDNIGGTRNGNTNQFHIIIASDRFDARYGTQTSNISFTTTGLFNFDFNKNKFYINNNLAKTFTNTTFTSNYNAYIFAVNNGGSATQKANYKLYNMKWYDNDALVRDFIPCYRNSDNEVGLYDLVNNVFYTNQGTGSFTYGEEITMLLEDEQMLLDGGTTIPFRINVNDNNNVITLTEDDIVDVSYEDFRYVDTNSIVVGQFVARKITGTLSSLNTQFEIEDTEIEIEMGVSYSNITHWYSLGNFLVTKPTSDDVKDKTTFEALDYTKKFNQAFDDSNLIYPCTAMELAEEVCRQCGVELGTDSFTNDDFIISDNQYTENDSCRKVMQDIGKLAYSWVRIGWDNKCYIDYEVENQVYDYSHNIIQTNKYYDLNKQNKVFGPVNRVVIGMKDVEGENAYIEDSESIAQYGVTELQIYDNNLTYTPELRQQVINGARRLFGLTYLPLEVNTVGHPWLIGKEKIGVVDTNGDTLYTYPFDRTIEYKGHIKTKLVSKADTKIETEYKNNGTLENEMRKTRIIVDKQNQTIEALAEEIVPVSNTISGFGSLTLENAYVGTLHRLEITGNIHVLTPSDTLYPSNTLYIKDTTITVDNQEYYPDFSYLNYINSTICDKYVCEDGKQWVERNVGVDNQGNLYQLSNTIIEESDNELIISVSSSSVISMLFFPNANLKSTYLLENQYTDTFAPTVDLVAKINLSPGLAQINAQKISLAGKSIDLTSDSITINSEHFNVDAYGNMMCNSAHLSGILETELEADDPTKNTKITIASNYIRFTSGLDEVCEIFGDKYTNSGEKFMDIIITENTTFALRYTTDNGITYPFFSFDSSDPSKTPYIRNTDNGNLFKKTYAASNNYPGVVIENGLVKSIGSNGWTGMANGFIVDDGRIVGLN